MTSRSSQLFVVSLLILSTLTFQAQARNVFAHFMMGNAYPLQDPSSYTNDISLAAAAGIEGFALNIGPVSMNDWMPDRVSKIFQAAKQFPDFKLFFSFDMSCMTDVNELIGYMQQYHSDSNYFQYNGAAFVSTFAGESQTFGDDNVNDGWQNKFKTPLQQQGINIFFVPSWTALGPNQVFESHPVLDGMFSWGAWPMDNSEMNTSGDQLYMQDAANNGKVYMAGVAPWFFAHFDYKNWIYKSESLWPTRWQQIVDLKPEFVEIITWNDYGESSYVGPIDAAMPAGSEAWVNGFEHQAWLDMAAYYIAAYKTGSYPAIQTDKVYYWYRTHSKNADRSDSLPRPNNADWADDNIVVTAFLTSPATIAVTTGGQTTQLNGNAGVNVFQVAFNEGDVVVSLQRNGNTLVSQQGGKPIQNGGNGYNFNAWVGKMEYTPSAEFLAI
jgi:glucan endo-1,3-alpha-glucosidase